MAGNKNLGTTPNVHLVLLVIAKDRRLRSFYRKSYSNLLHDDFSKFAFYKFLSGVDTESLESFQYILMTKVVVIMILNLEASEHAFLPLYDAKC